MKKSVVNLFFLGKIDDVEKDLPEEMKKFKDRLYGTYLDVNSQIRFAEKEVKELSREISKLNKVLQSEVNKCIGLLQSSLWNQLWLWRTSCVRPKPNSN